MSDSDVLSAAWTLNPRSVERARRLAVAIDLIRQGRGRREACMMLRARFPRIGQPEAWRLVDFAVDMAQQEKALLQEKA